MGHSFFCSGIRENEVCHLPRAVMNASSKLNCQKFPGMSLQHHVATFSKFITFSTVKKSLTCLGRVWHFSKHRVMLQEPQIRPCCVSRDFCLQAKGKCHPAALQMSCGVTALPQLGDAGAKSFLLPHIHIKFFHHRQQAQAAGGSMSIEETSSCSGERNGRVGSRISPKCRFTPARCQALGHPAHHVQHSQLFFHQAALPPFQIICKTSPGLPQLWALQKADWIEPNWRKFAKPRWENTSKKAW